MKNKGIYIASIIFFLLVNTRQLWIDKIGVFSIVLVLIMILGFIILSFILFGQIIKAFGDKLENRKRLFLITLMVVVLTTALTFPGGIINFKRSGQTMYNESLLVAQRKSDANCNTTLFLSKNNTFVEKVFCFGSSKIAGDYRISGDTIYFEKITLSKKGDEYFEFAIIKKVSSVNNKLGDIVRYKDKSDTIGVALWIIKNDLPK